MVTTPTQGQIKTVGELIAFLIDTNASPTSYWPGEDGMVLLYIHEKDDYVDLGWDWDPDDTFEGLNTRQVLDLLKSMPVALPIRSAGGLLLRNICYNDDGFEVYTFWDDRI